MSELKASNLRKRYRSRVVVQDVSLSVSSGQVVGLLGPNGAGKTTCFYMIVGLVAVDGGRIDLDGTEIHHLPMHARARMGLCYLPQEASVFRKLSVEENILAVLELRDLSEEERQQRLNDLLADLNISHLRNNPALSLSGGERRRVEIARALGSAPRLLLLDEPTAGMNAQESSEIGELTHRLRDGGLTVLMVEHNVRLVREFCDAVTVMNFGRLLAKGRPAECIEHPDVQAAYFGKRADAERIRSLR